MGDEGTFFDDQIGYKCAVENSKENKRTGEIVGEYPKQTFREWWKGYVDWSHRTKSEESPETVASKAWKRAGYLATQRVADLCSDIKLAGDALRQEIRNRGREGRE